MKENKSCLNCKHVAYMIENRINPIKSIFYCEWRQEIYMNTYPCEYYQEKSN